MGDFISTQSNPRKVFCCSIRKSLNRWRVSPARDSITSAHSVPHRPGVKFVV